MKIFSLVTSRQNDSLKPRKYLIFFSMVLFLLLADFPNLFQVAPQFGVVDASYGVIWMFWFFLIWLAVWGRLGLALLAGMVFLAWWPIEIYLRISMQTVINPTLLGMVWDTNFAELKEFIGAHLYHVIGWVLFLLLLLLVTVWAWRARIAWRGRSRWLVLLTAPAALTLLLEYYPNMELENKNPELFEDVLPAWLMSWKQLYPFTGLSAYMQLLQESHQRKVLSQAVREFRFDVAKIAPNMPRHIVLVLGESSRRNRWSLYGYRRPTTPGLDREQQLLAFTDVVSIANATRSSIPSLMSRAPLQRPDGKPSGHPEPSLVKLFKQLGYRTVWLSNQTNSGSEDTPLSFIAADADKRVFLNTVNYDHQGTFDEALLPRLQAELNQPGPVMLVLHTLGSHFEYANRYPAAQRRFGEDPLLDDKHHHASSYAARMSEKNKRLEDDYDNSVAYTDQFLTQVLKALRADESTALLVYVSDHGEDLPADGCNYQIRTRYSRYAFEVPAFFWLSPAYLSQSPERWEKLQQVHQQPMLSTDLFDLITEAAGVKLNPRTEISANPASGREVYTGQEWVNYDERKVTHVCNFNSR